LLNDRHGLLVSRCRGKKVLHLGCVDVGLVEERFRRGELLHQRLAAVASELWGVDIDAAGIAFLRSQGFTNLLAGDICQLHDLATLRGQDFDVIVASEVVEHLSNPGLFLSGIRNLMAPGRTELIVTVPNAFRVETLLWLLRGVECVHPDHNFWFSYRTATNLLHKSGLTIGAVYAYSLQPWGILPAPVRRLFGRLGKATACETVGPTPPVVPPTARLLAYLRSLPRRLLVTWLYRTTPFWGDGLILVATVMPNAR
jgi:SAM-dependent methyltransferase